MPITLDKNDAPQLASAVIDAFKKLPTVYTEEKLKTLFTPDNAENQQLIKEAIEGIKQLGEAGLDPKGSNVKVGAVLHFVFPNKDVLEKLFPVFMAAEFKDLPAATRADFDKLKAANQKVQTAATALQTQLSTALEEFGKLNTALTPAVPPPAEAALTRETIFTSITTADTAKWSTLAAAIAMTPTTPAAGTTAAVYAPPAAANKEDILGNLKTAVETAPPAPTLEPALIAIDAKLTVAAVKAALAAPVAEAFIRSFDLSKKLYEAGFITRSEYTGKLLETRSLLTEAAPALTPEVTAAREALGQLVAGCGNATTGFARVDFAPLVANIQSSWTKYAAATHIAESHRRLAKAQVKHRILREAKRQGVKKEMLNEFLLAILGGIIAAVAGWIGKKFGEWFKGGPAVSIVPVGPGAGVSHSKEDADLMAYYAGLEEAYQDLKGEHTPDGKSFNRDAAITKATGLTVRLTAAQTKWTALLGTCTVATVTAAAYPPPSGAAVQAAFAAAMTAGTPVSVAGLNTALNELITYFKT